jgi:ATP-dependent RNA helicase DeaD
MAFSSAPPSLGRALTARGFTEPTPVQAAIMAPEVAGRDVLVSAQTGSGKTVAFGLALAQTLLGEAERFTPAGAPRALIVTPTRELAMQVQRELSWLYAETGARIATCVGGMDPRRESHALGQGVHLVVGTPGRLCDHLARGSLVLDRLAAVVLDEADEMLDMGFREDLERLLDAAPAERRTLLFSATIPGPIAALAKRYQRNALRIATSGERDRHRDIEYQVVSIVPRERDLAVVNLLRFYDPPGALVFCGTRDGVTHLAANLSERGFSVAALSGELSQRERNQALQALRDGRARVCVATDVAARGLDLPDLGLVIHADLPQSKEMLVHRSGRTGRAGKSGLAIVIAVDAAGRFVERLLRSAGIEASWRLPPSSDDIRDRDQAKLAGEIQGLTEDVTEADRAVARTLLGDRSAEDLVAALVRLRREARPAPEELTVPPSMRPRASAGARDSASRGPIRSRFEQAGKPPRRGGSAERALRTELAERSGPPPHAERTVSTGHAKQPEPAKRSELSTRAEPTKRPASSTQQAESARPAASVDPAARVQAVAAIEPETPVQRAESAHPDAPVDPAARVQAVAAIEPGTPVQRAELAQPAASIDPTLRVQAVAAIDPGTPVQRTELARAVAPAEQVARVQAVAAIDPGTPVQRAELAQPAASVDPAARVQAVAAIEPGTPVQRTELARAVAPAEQVARVQAVAAVEPGTPVQRAELAHPGAPVDPAARAQAVAALEPGTPVQRTELAHPGAPVDPAARVQAVAALEPGTPVQRAELAQPAELVDPAARVQAVTAIEPGTPVQSTELARAVAPAEQVARVQAVAAVEPGTPVQRTELAHPGAPVDPTARVQAVAAIEPGAAVQHAELDAAPAQYTAAEHAAPAQDGVIQHADPVPSGEPGERAPSVYAAPSPRVDPAERAQRPARVPSDDRVQRVERSRYPARGDRPESAERPHGRRERPAFAARSAPDDKLVWFTINIGRSKNADPRWLIPLLCRRGGISKSSIGKIQILARETRVEISHAVSERFAAAVREPDTKDRNIHIEPLDAIAL